MASVERKAKSITATFAKTRKGKRVLEERAPKLEESAKRILILHGNKVSQVVKDVLLDVNKLRKQDSVKFSRKNEVRPFEPGGESALQFFCERSDCPLFVLGQHSKKRPHNLVLGRLFNFQLLDMLELGIRSHTPLTALPGAAKVAAGSNKPCFLFVGERFEAHPDFALAKSLLLDLFRGEAVDELNLMGLDHVMAAYAPDDKTLILRTYHISLKRSGTRIPRVQLEPLGPTLDLEMRRALHPPADLAKEANTHPKLGKKKQKNVGFEPLEGRVGRIYMPTQDLNTVAIVKPKGVKRDRRLAAKERKAKKHAGDNEPAGEGPPATADDAMDEDDE